MTKEQPIGIFDSGIGGLTVAYAVTQKLRGENILYFGDTAHLPYGDKSSAAIQAYSVKICDLLLKQHCKLILIACNSASAAAYELVREYVGSKAYVMNVIDPVIGYLHDHHRNKAIGLIGTKKTIKSNVYKKKIDQLDAGIDLRSMPTPLLAPMIEEGFFDNSISESIIRNYLSNKLFQGIEALILGCTHYPLIKQQIQECVGSNVEVIDSSEIVAQAVLEFLRGKELLNTEDKPFRRFFVSDYTQSFEESTRLFFRQEVSLEHYPLWE